MVCDIIKFIKQVEVQIYLFFAATNREWLKRD